MKTIQMEMRMWLMTGNQDRLENAQKKQRAVILIFGRATQLKGPVAALYFKAKQMSGLNRQQAKEHAYAAVANYGEKLNQAINRSY